MYQLYGCSSPNVYKVSIMLEEAGLDYELRHIDIFSGDQLTPEFLAVSPNNKVPVLVDLDGPDGASLAVSESGAILIYLAEKTGLFLPMAPAARAATMQWLMVQMASIGPMFGQFGHFSRYAPPGNDYALARYQSEVGRLISVLDRRLAVAPFLNGESYSIADMATLPWVLTAIQLYEIPLDDHPALRSWVDELQARPAVQRGIGGLAGKWAVSDMASLQSASRDALDRTFGIGAYSHAISKKNGEAQ